jgi:hypothetical protein
MQEMWANKIGNQGSDVPLQLIAQGSLLVTLVAKKESSEVM